MIDRRDYEGESEWDKLCRMFGRRRLRYIVVLSGHWQFQIQGNSQDSGGLPVEISRVIYGSLSHVLIRFESRERMAHNLLSLYQATTVSVRTPKVRVQTTIISPVPGSTVCSRTQSKS